jgi:3-keto-5-aminohexanoate cleavage enzyme
MIPTKGETPYVPTTPEEIANDTYEAYKLGASIVHVHARDETGQPTYKKGCSKKSSKKSNEDAPT